MKKKPKPTAEQQLEALNGELFLLVEGDQGEAFVSDGLYARDLKEFFDFTEAQRFYAREVVKKMTRFLRKHRKLRPQRHARIR